MNFDVLIGKQIVKVTDDKKEKYNANTYSLYCSDGTIITVKENEGCGGCENGWSDFSEIKKLENVDNVITNVEYEKSEDTWLDDNAKLFVFYDRPEYNQILNADEGWGNGYYGGGFYINVVGVDKENENNDC